MSLKISSLHLEAFFAVAKFLSFSNAAKSLRVTQSALSQRMINFEESLGVSLFIRDPSGLRLTESGLRMLRYCRLSESLEDEMLEDIRGGGESHKLQGRMCIGGFSSVMWSVVAPAVGQLVSKHPEVQIEMMVRELDELPTLLKTGAIDYALLDAPSERADVESKLLGYEKNVLVSSNKVSAQVRQEVFLDHDSNDQTTYKYFQHNGIKRKLRRAFLDDIHGLIAGVSHGLGVAVLPEHLLPLCRNIVVDTSLKPLFIPIYVHYCMQPYYTKLHQQVIRLLADAFVDFKKT